MLEVNEVNDVCFVRQMVIFFTHGGIVDNFANFANFTNFTNFTNYANFTY